jgi:hypothetical protein
MSDPRPSEPRAGRHLRALPSPEVDTSDWPAQAADAIERTVQSVRSKTTGPAITAARWLVAGLFVLVAGTVVAILLAIALVRVLDAYLPDSVFGEDHVWAAHLLVGLPLFVFGMVLLAKRNSPDTDAS